jgi:hypothetical protein
MKVHVDVDAHEKQLQRLRDYKDAALSQTGNTTAASLFLRYLLSAPKSEITLEEFRIRFESEQWPIITKPSDSVDTAHIPHDYNLAASPLTDDDGLLLLQRLSKFDQLSPALSRWPVPRHPSLHCNRAMRCPPVSPSSYAMFSESVRGATFHPGDAMPRTEE